MASQGDVSLKISADLAEFKTAMLQASAEIKKFAATAKQNGTGDLGFGEIKKSINGAMASVRTFAAGLATIYTAGRLLKLADDVALVNARLRLAVGGVKEFAAAQELAYAVALKTGAGYASVATLYARLSLTAKDYGLSQQQIANVTESTALALRVSGASASESASVITQLSQALGSGVLRGEEFNSIMENGGRLAKALADGLGLPIGKLREMSKAGALTTEIVAQALESQRDVLEREAAAMPRTIEASLAGVRDQFGKFANELNQSAGITTGVAAAFDALGRNIKDVIGVSAVAAIGAATVATTKMAAAAYASVQAKLAEIAAERAKIVALQQTAAAEVVASQAALRAAVAQEAAAAAALAEARALQADVVALGIYGERRAAANRQVAAAAAAHTAATAAISGANTRLAAAQAGATAAMTATGLAARALSGMVGFLGGPIGIITTLLTVGATAWAIWGNSAKTAGDKAKEAVEAGLAAARRMAKESQFGTGDLGALNEAREELEKRIDILSQSASRAGSQAAAEKLTQARKELAEIETAINEAQKREAGMGAGGATALGREVLERSMGDFLKTFRSKQDELAAAIEEFKAKANELAAGDAAWKEGGAKFEKGIADIRAKFKNKGGALDLQAMKVQIDESFRLTKDGLDRESRALDSALEQRRISIADWYAEKDSIAEEQFANERARLEKERQAAVDNAARIQAVSAKASKPEDRQRAENAVLTAKNAVAKIDADLIILERERASTLGKLATDAASKEREYQKAIEDTRTALKRAQGDELGARLNEIASARKEAQARFANDPAALDLVDQLFNTETAKAKFDELQRQFDEIMQRSAQFNQSLDNQVQVGSIDPQTAQAQQSEQRAKTVAELDAVTAAMQRLAAETNNPAIVEGAQKAQIALQNAAIQSATGIEAAIISLRSAVKNMADTFATSASNAGVDAMTTLFTDIANGSKSAGDAVKDFVRNFAQSMVQLAARALSTYLVLTALDAIYPGLGKASAAAMGAGSRHTGGMAGAGPVRRVNPLVFAGAPRYHDGGVVGLKSDEVPAILQKGEEVLAKNDPRNVTNGGASGGGTRIINVIDPSLVSDYMSSSSGEKTVLNVLQRNPGTVKQIINS